MSKRKTLAYTLTFIALFALAGVLHVYEKVPSYALNTVIFCALTFIYFGLILVWYSTIRVRLLPTLSRRYILAAAWFMLAYIFLRTVRYRVASVDDITLQQFTWYFYYAPVLFIPTLFLMVCIYSATVRADGTRRFDERWLLVLPAVLFVLVVTNNLHHWAFVPTTELPIIGHAHTYTYGWLFYVVWAMCFVEALGGVGVLVRATRRRMTLAKAIIPVGVAVVLVVLLFLDNRLGAQGTVRPYLTPEITSFGMMTMFECCIRLRLFPYNENYEGFFGSLQWPAAVTDRDLEPRWVSAQPLGATKEMMHHAIYNSVYINSDRRLCAYPLRAAGYVFYTEDESNLHETNRRLDQANQALEEENALIEMENELREAAAHVESRSKIYAHINAVMHKRQEHVAALLEGAVPNAPDFGETIAKVLVHTTFIKRGANMLLAAQEADEIPVAELQLAMNESMMYLKYCDIHAGCVVADEGSLPGQVLFDLYSTLEDIVEALLRSCTRIIVFYEGGVLRVSANCRTAPDVEGTALPVSVKKADGAYYFTVHAKGGDV